MANDSAAINSSSLEAGAEIAVISQAKQAISKLSVQALNMPFYVLVCQLKALVRAYQNQVNISVHYVSAASMAFIAREISEVLLEEKDGYLQVTVVVNFMGLQSTDTPLPLVYQEQVVQDVHRDQFELHDFYNFFNQRALTLLESGLGKYDYPTRCDEGFKDGLSKIWVGLSGLYPEIEKAEKPNKIQHKLLKSMPWIFGKNMSLANIAKVIMGRFKTDYENLCHVHIHLQDAFKFLPKTKGYEELREVLQWLLPTRLLYKISMYIDKAIPATLSEAPLYLGWTTKFNNKGASAPEQQVIKL